MSKTRPKAPVNTLLVTLLLALGPFLAGQTGQAIPTPAGSVPWSGPGVYVHRQPDPALLPDVAWYRQTLVDTVDRWNGGATGQTGMGAYKPGFSGYFQVNLNRDWSQGGNREATSIIAQCRAVYMNVEAWANAPPADQERFARVARKGADFLLDHYLDAEYGGYYWSVDPRGKVKDDQKQGYGQCKALMVLSKLARASGETKYYQAARDQLETILDKLADPRYPGAMLPGANRDFSRIQGGKNSDYSTHFFEALLAYGEVAKGPDKTLADATLEACGSFILEHLSFPRSDKPDQYLLAYNYTDDWQPASSPYSRSRQWVDARHATPGHAIELAWLLCRASEEGHNPQFALRARQLLDWCLEFAINPRTGGMNPDILDYDGRPLPGNPDNTSYVWWPQSETARTLLYFSLRQDPGLKPAFRKIQSLIVDHLIDPQFGGWFDGLRTRDLAPRNPGFKGNNWKVNYHVAMFYAEAIRLGEMQGN